jgi:hypothetical protein
VCMIDSKFAVPQAILQMHGTKGEKIQCARKGAFRVQDGLVGNRVRQRQKTQTDLWAFVISPSPSIAAYWLSKCAVEHVRLGRGLAYGAEVCFTHGHTGHNAAFACLNRTFIKVVHICRGLLLYDAHTYPTSAHARLIIVLMPTRRELS